MDPGLLTLGALAVGAAALLPKFSKSGKEGFEVVPGSGYPSTATKGAELYNKLTLASDPRMEAIRVDQMPEAQQTAYKNAVDAALANTTVTFDRTGPVVTTTASTNPVHIPDEDSILKRAAFCANTPITADVFKNAQFAKDCGVCVSAGTTYDNKPFTKPMGMFILPEQKTSYLNERTDKAALYSRSKPTYGYCQGATAGADHDFTFALDDKEYGKMDSRMKCKTNRQLDGNCASCLADSSFTYVGKENRTLQTVTFWLWGNNGILEATMGGTRIDFNPPQKLYTVQLSPSSVRKFSVVLKEGAFINFSLSGVGWNADSKKLVVSEFWGYADFPNEKGGIDSIPLEQFIYKDAVTGDKPKFKGIFNYNGLYLKKMIKASGVNSVMLSGQMPFLLVNDWPFEGIDCKTSFLQTLPESVEKFGGDPCYKPSTQGPGTWTDACLKDRVLTLGCTTNGKLYQDTSSLKNMTMTQIIQAVQGLVSKQYSDSDSSMKCNGRNISTPCDPYVGLNPSEAPDLTAQCIDFLYFNRGADKPQIGPTYSGPVNTYYSLDKDGKRIMCLPGGTMDPNGPNGAASVREFQNYYRNGWSGRSGLDAVKGVMNYNYNRALQLNLPADTTETKGGRKESIEKCFFKLANIPENILPDTKLPNAQYCRIRSPPGRVDCMNFSAVAVFDNRDINVAQGKTCSASSLYMDGKGGASISAPVDGTRAARAYPKGFHDKCGKTEFWMVDFGKVYPIKRIEFYNRQDCCAQRANSLVLELLDNTKKVVWTQTLNGDMTQTYYTFLKVQNV